LNVATQEPRRPLEVFDEETGSHTGEQSRSDGYLGGVRRDRGGDMGLCMLLDGDGRALALECLTT
jgi:hypothetical protein